MMKHLYEELILRFRNKQVESDNFDVDGLWLDIEKELPQASKKRPLIIWILASLFIIVPILLLNISKEKKDIKSSVLNEAPHELNTKEIIDATTSYDLELKANSQQSLYSKILDDSASVIKSVYPEVSDKFSLTDQGIKLINKKARIGIDLSNTLKNGIDTIQTKETQGYLSYAERNAIKPFNPIRVNHIIQFSEDFNVNHNLEIADLAGINVEPSAMHLNKPRISLGLKSGVNWSSFSYDLQNNNLKNLLEMSASQVLGYNFGFGLSVDFDEQFFVSTGLSYNQSWIKFEANTTFADQMLLEDQLVKVRVDKMTRDTLEYIIKDTLVNATAHREVRHYNQYRFVNVPFELGVRKMLSDKLSFGLVGGVSLNFMTLQEGKTYDNENMIVEFSANDNPRPISKFSLGWRLSPQLNYRLSENLALQIASSLVTHNNIGVSDSERIKWRLVQLNVGLNYRLN